MYLIPEGVLTYAAYITVGTPDTDGATLPGSELSASGDTKFFFGLDRVSLTVGC